MEYVDLVRRDTTDGRLRVMGDSGRRYEIINDTPVIILKIAKILCDNFGFKSKKPVSGMDGSVVVCTKGDTIVLLGWQSGSGIYMKGKSEKGVKAERELFPCFHGILGHKILDGYICKSP
jgi:hypothetical protein